jgi:proteasome lid subunit RPN8/RPN11
MRQELVGTIYVSIVVAFHSHPVSTGWINEADQPVNRFNGFSRQRNR